MRTITLIVVHCSGNRFDSKLRCKDIDRYHRSLRWNGCGYHYVIPTDGVIEKGRPLAQVGAHVGPAHNPHSIGVCYIGGIDKDGKHADTRTPKQKESLLALLSYLHARFPKALIVSHHTLNPFKDCPCFDAEKEYADLQPH